MWSVVASTALKACGCDRLSGVHTLSKKNGMRLNSARAMVGRHVNLHLRDGSVIVNVRVVEALRGSPSVLFYKTVTKSRRHRVSLRDVAWLEPLNLYLFTLA